MEIILLSGWSNSGKDFVADYFSKWGFTKLSFADELKKIVSKKYNIPLEQTMTQEGKQTIIPGTGKTVRTILIEEARTIRRENGTEYFARLLALTILEKYLSKVVISDWRFPIELETLQELFFKYTRFHTIRITRHGQLLSPVAHIATENQLDSYPFSYQIENPGVFSMNQNLYHQIKTFLIKIGILDKNAMSR